MKLYKFRQLRNDKDLCRIKEIINKGFHCNTFLDFNDMNEGVFLVNSNNKDIKVADKKAYKICSFSEEDALNNELMWGHYANAGKGVVIEVDSKSKCIHKVCYGGGKCNNEIEILTTKSAVWQYECEYRYLSKKSLTDNKVEIGKITKIYFGKPYKSLGNYGDILLEHKKLQNYLKYKECLESFCDEEKINIECKDYSFKLLTD